MEMETKEITELTEEAIATTLLKEEEEEGEQITGKRKRDDDDEEENPNCAKTKTETEESVVEKSHPLWKTSLCSFYRSSNGVCSHGDTCRFAHGESELRQRPNKSWDPTSTKAKKIQNITRKQIQNNLNNNNNDSLDSSCSNGGLNKCLIGLPRNWGSDNLKKFLDDNGIKYQLAKKKKKMAVSFVVFENAGQVEHAVEVFKEKLEKGKEIKMSDATPRFQKRRDTVDGFDDENDGVVVDDDGTSVMEEELVPKTKSVRDVATPLAHMTYADQLEQKKNSLMQTLRKLPKNGRKACPESAALPDWILNAREIGGLPCKLEGILESPVVDGYRNKCEFTVGYSVQGKRTVGFKPGNFIEGVTEIEEPDICPNVSKISCKYAHIFQDFLQSSEFPVWNQHNNTGFWRQLTVREGRAPNQASVHVSVEIPIAEVMLMVQVCSLNADEARMKNEFSRMAQAFAEGAASCDPPLPLTILVVQDHTGISNSAPADCPLIPLPVPIVESDSKSSVMESRIHDYISNLRFSISPTAFFQVNTLAAERMYSLAGDWAELSPDTLLFDICCGTGTIGLTLAHRVGMVVGIEMNESAVSDANRNAEINGIKNCKFVCGKAENVIGSVLKEYLDVPEQRNDASNDSNKVANGSSCTIASNTDNANNDALEDENTNHVTDSINNSTTFLKLCTTERIPITQENKEYRDESQFVLNNADNRKENGECQNTGQANYTSEKKGVNKLSDRQFKDVVAIVDPPRCGLHTVVIKALRTHPRIRRLVYISCNPESLVANAIELCTPSPDKLEKAKGNKQWRSMSIAGLARHRIKSMPISEPFKPVKAMGVDLFPHTLHCEMVMLLER